MVAAGIEPLGRIYDLRYGASLTMIDPHYGHLTRRGREPRRAFSTGPSAGQCPRWTLVDAAWTPTNASTTSGDNGNII
jgi:hypothetical protein